MYNILIADDEKIERNGIISLIEKYKFPLKIYEAKNGIEALEALKTNSIDILFTDIRMPVIDGLELAGKARDINPEMKIIIYSAYGEFDYAKKAIDINVVKYLLKPINRNEFQNVISKVIQECDDEKKLKENQSSFQQIYQKMASYEKEKLLLGLINGRNTYIDYQGYTIQMMFLDFNEKFFDTKDNEFSKAFADFINLEYDYLNINERQSIVFIKTIGQGMDKHELKNMGECLLKHTKEKYETNVYIVFGDAINRIEDLKPEYDRIEEVLEYKFFLDESTILFTENEYMLGNFTSAATDKILKNVYQFIECRDFHSLYKNIELLFDCIKASEGISAIFVKHIFTGILKELYKKVNETDSKKIKTTMEEALGYNNMQQLKELMFSTLKTICTENEATSQENGNRLIEEVLNIIRCEYQKDLSLEYLAEKVYLSPTYLSSLFKKKVGESLVKYINNYRLDKARELLDDTNIKIVDISKKIGYSNQSYFCTIFKNYYGITPAQYRERVK